MVRLSTEGNIRSTLSFSLRKACEAYHQYTRDIPLLPDEIRDPPSDVWSGLRKFAQVERHGPMPAVVVT
jgi:hypothetical protein